MYVLVDPEEDVTRKQGSDQWMGKTDRIVTTATRLQPSAYWRSSYVHGRDRQAPYKGRPVGNSITRPSWFLRRILTIEFRQTAGLFWALKRGTFDETA